MLALGFISAASLATGGACLLALLRTRAMVHAVQANAPSRPDASVNDLESLQQSVDSLAAQLHDLQQQPQGNGPGAPARHGLNMSKRSQALRMYRRGDAPGQIALTLGIPQQEMDLLLKVHRIVLGNIDSRPAAPGV